MKTERTKKEKKSIADKKCPLCSKEIIMVPWEYKYMKCACGFTTTLKEWSDICREVYPNKYKKGHCSVCGKKRTMLEAPERDGKLLVVEKCSDQKCRGGKVFSTTEENFDL